LSIESNVDSESSTKTAEKVHVPSRAKSSRWSEGLLSLFSPQVRFIETTLHDIQDEQQRLGNAISSLRVDIFLIIHVDATLLLFELCTERCMIVLYLLC